MTTIDTSLAALTDAELVARATSLIPMLRANAHQAEIDRRLPDENVQAVHDAGILAMFRPRQFGGYAEPPTIRTKMAVLSELARGCASTAWASMIWIDINWVGTFFPIEAQEEIFARPDSRINATLNPTGTATPVEGGYRLNGSWAFNSGSTHAHWCAQPAIIQDPNAPLPALFLMSYDDDGIERLDDWDPSGLCASESNTVIANDVFVPEHRVLLLPPFMSGAAEPSDEAPVYRVPPPHFIASSVIPAVVGIAKSALDLFMERLPGRTITYSTGTLQSESGVTHLQVGEAALKIQAAELMAYRMADDIDASAALGETLSIEERAQIRGATGMVTRLCGEATEILRSASGATGILKTVPMQRVARDMQALLVHAYACPHTNMELYGRVKCGLEPNSVWL